MCYFLNESSEETGGGFFAFSSAIMKMIGKYQILSILGRGGMGIVYKAMDPDIEREVAIKTVHFDSLTDGQEKEDLLAGVIKEAKAAGRLKHPNIITIYDVIRDEDMTYIVMQYVDGPSLEALIASGKSLSPREIVDILRPVSDALDFAHRGGIIHRDIKPANILFDKSGQPFLVDFGVARISTATLTQSRTTSGTLNYMSPEQVKGQTVDSRSDIFALGVILYELLTGKKPFGGDNMSAIVYRIVNEEPQHVSDINKDLHGGYDSVVLKVLAKKPEDRYQSCLEMIADLENQGWVAEVSQDYETGREIGRERNERRTFLALVAAVVLVGVLAGGGYLLFSSRPAKSSEFAKNVGTTKKEMSSLVTSSAPPPAVPPPVASAETGAPEDAALLKLQQSYDAKTYQETARLAREILTKEPANAVAKEYLEKANAGIAAAKIAQLLQSGIAAYGNGDYAQCVADLKKVLEIDKDNSEARRYLVQAESAIAAPEITALIERLRVAEENKDLLTVLSLYDSPGLADSVRADHIALFNGYNGIKSIISQVSVRLSGDGGATATFSELLTAVSKKTGQRKILFEGRKTWRLRKQGQNWKISAVQ